MNKVIAVVVTFNFIKEHKYKFSDYFLFASMIKRGIKGELGKMNLNDETPANHRD